jgi:hypothetical protein
LLIVACGFDASGFDPMGRMILSASAFAELTQRMLTLASDVCGGRLVMAQEGGYSPLHVPLCGAAVISVLMGLPQPPIDDYGRLDDFPDRPLTSNQQTAIDAASAAAMRSGALRSHVVHAAEDALPPGCQALALDRGPKSLWPRRFASEIASMARG